MWCADGRKDADRIEPETLRSLLAGLGRQIVEPTATSGAARILVRPSLTGSNRNDELDRQSLELGNNSPSLLTARSDSDENYNIEKGKLLRCNYTGLSNLYRCDSEAFD